MRIDRSHAAALGRQTVQIIQSGAYLAPSGHTVDVREAIARAIANTQSYPPGQEIPRVAPGQVATNIAVMNATTLDAAHTLVAAGHRPVALNFASARHPGGGFLSGARAQEESLARASALYACLADNPMYAWHEAHRSPLYSDYAIYSPAVPVFRDDSGALLDIPYECAFITCAAVNTRVALERDPACLPTIHDAMASRVERVLAIAATHAHTRIVLGAWGCGVFGNDPREIVQLFRAALAGPYRDVFAEVIFAIVDWSPDRMTIGPFEQAFSSGWDHDA